MTCVKNEVKFWPEPKPAPRGVLLYGERGICHVWEHSNTGRICWHFDDEDLAMQCAVKLGSMVKMNNRDVARGGSQPTNP